MNHKPSTGSIFPNLVTAVCSGFLLCLSPHATTGTEEERIEIPVPEEGSEFFLPQTATGAEDGRPVVLQYRVSHPRNTDQVSLVFRQDIVQLVVNTDFWQKETMPRRLGMFGALYNRELSRLKRRLELYHDYHTHTVSILSLLDIPDIPGLTPTPDPIPHAPPCISIGGEEVSSKHDHYEALFRIIRSVWDHKWICVHCAFYRIRGGSIMRTIRPSVLYSNFSSDDREKYFTDEFIESRRLEFSKSVKIPQIDRPWEYSGEESLDCYQTGVNGPKMECLDPKFGLFKLPMPGQDTSSASRP